MDLRLVLVECLAVNEFTSNEEIKNYTLTIYDLVSKEAEALNPKTSVNQSAAEVNEIKKKLKLLLKQYQNCIKARKEFFSNYSKWAETRRQNIHSLETIAEAINLNRRNCNISKLVGNSVGILGSLVCGASVVLLPFTFGATTPLAIAGAAAGAAGGAVTIGASATEVVLEAQNMKAAQTIIDQDKESMQDTISWYKQSEELKELLDELVGFSMMNEISQQLSEFFKHFETLQDAIKSNKFLSVIQNLLKLLSMQARICIEFLPLMIAVIFATIMIDKKHRFMVDTLLFLQRTAAIVSFLIDVLTDGGLLALNCLKGVNGVVLKAAARGGLAAFGLALDITSMVLTSIDVHNGSRSKNAETLFKCAKALGQELEHFQSLYDELQTKNVTKSDLAE